MNSVLRAVFVTGALVVLLGGCRDEERSSAPPATAPATPAASELPGREEAFVVEVRPLLHDLPGTRADLIDLGNATCLAFRLEPGTVATLADDMRKAGQTDEEIQIAQAIAIAAIHNLCPDQTEDL